ncbi:hypothetical protein [Aporhodopirellula aestuarii]|nr:hypothetical protein [Aporhodopirellula aestuarii]
MTTSNLLPTNFLAQTIESASNATTDGGAILTARMLFVWVTT